MTQPRERHRDVRRAGHGAMQRLRHRLHLSVRQPQLHPRLQPQPLAQLRRLALRRSPRLLVLPHPRLRHVLRHLPHRPTGQRTRLLCRLLLPEDADGDEPLHREPRGGRHPDDGFLRAVHLRPDTVATVLAVRQDHVQYRQLLTGHLRVRKFPQIFL